MALLLRWAPFKPHIENTTNTRPFQNPLLCSPSPLFFSTSSSTSQFSRRITSNPDLFSFSISSATKLPSSSSSINSVVGTEETKSENETRTRLIAQNIPWTCTGEDIRSLFQKHGTVLDVELSMQNKTRNRGLAFVTMASEEEALAALNALNSYELGGRVIKVDFARTQKKKSSNQPVVTLPKHNVFVANLSWKVKSKDLKELFQSLNSNVVAAKVIHRTDNRKPTGYGFVSFASKEEAKAAISTYQGKILMGRPIRLGKGRRNLDEDSIDGIEIEETSTEVNDDCGQSEN